MGELEPERNRFLRLTTRFHNDSNIWVNVSGKAGKCRSGAAELTEHVDSVQNHEPHTGRNRAITPTPDSDWSSGATQLALAHLRGRTKRCREVLALAR